MTKERFKYDGEKLVNENPLLDTDELKRLKNLKEDLTNNKEKEETKEILTNFEKKGELVTELERAFGQYLTVMDGDPKIPTNEKDDNGKQKQIDIFKDLYLPITKELNWEPKKLSDMMSHFEGNIENHAGNFLSEINKNKPAKPEDLQSLVRMIGMYVQRRKYTFEGQANQVERNEFGEDIYQLFDINSPFRKKMDDISKNNPTAPEKIKDIIKIEDLEGAIKKGDLVSIIKFMEKLGGTGTTAEKEKLRKILIQFNTKTSYIEFDKKISNAQSVEEKIDALGRFAHKIEYAHQFEGITIKTKDPQHSNVEIEVPILGIYNQKPGAGHYQEIEVMIGNKIVKKKGLFDVTLAKIEDEVKKKFPEGDSKRKEYLSVINSLSYDNKDKALEFGLTARPDLETPGQANIESLAYQEREDIFINYLGNLRRIDSTKEGNKEIIKSLTNYPSSQLYFEYLSYIRSTDIDKVIKNIESNPYIKQISFNLDLLAKNYPEKDFQHLVRKLSNLQKKVIFIGSGNPDGNEKIYTTELMKIIGQGKSKEIEFRGILNAQQATALLTNRKGSLSLPETAGFAQATGTKELFKEGGAFDKWVQNNQNGNKHLELGLTNVQGIFKDIFKVLTPTRETGKNKNPSLTIKFPRLIESQTDVNLWMDNGLTCNVEMPRRNIIDHKSKEEISPNVFKLSNLTIGLEKLDDKYREALKSYKGDSLGLNVTEISVNEGDKANSDAHILAGLKHLRELKLINEKIKVSKEWLKPILSAKNIKKLTLGKINKREFYETLETPKENKTMSKEEYELLRKFEYLELNTLTELTDEAYELFKADNNTMLKLPNLTKITIKDFEKSPFAALRKKDGGEIHFGNIHTIELPIKGKDGKRSKETKKLDAITILQDTNTKLLEPIFEELYKYETKEPAMRKIFIDGFLGTQYFKRANKKRLEDATK